jgi:Icc-related predicted phosphoesterase
LLKRTTVPTIYGNHENMDVLRSLYNVESGGYLSALMEDGRVYEVGGLRVAGINGIVAPSGRPKRGVPRKKPEDYLAVAEQHARQKPMDVLLMHETPFLPSLFPFMSRSVGAMAALRAVEIVKPRLVVNGHMHSQRYGMYDFLFGTRYMFIDSSQQHRCYAVLYPKEDRVEVWRDLDKVSESSV